MQKFGALQRRGSFRQTFVVSRLLLRDSRISCRDLRQVMLFGALEHGGTVVVDVEKKDGKDALVFRFGSVN